MAAGAGARGTARACADGRGWRAEQASGTARRGRSARQAGRGRARRAAWARGARGVGARGARPGRAWARLVHWLGQFEAHAASLGFDLGFLLGSVSESPFGLGS